LIIPVIPTKVAELVAKGTTQLVKPTKVTLRYPCIIYYSYEHCAFDCFRKIEVQNMFRTKPNNITIEAAKNHKPDNVPVNVIVIVTTHN
jgi:hypothetical protein